MLQGRPFTCHDCNDRKRKQRGCKAAGRDTPRADAPVRWYSPALQDREDRLAECPTSYLLREAPWVWEMIEASAMVERMTPDAWALAPRAARTAARLYSSEMARAREAEDARRKSKAASEYGQRVVSHG